MASDMTAPTHPPAPTLAEVERDLMRKVTAHTGFAAHYRSPENAALNGAGFCASKAESHEERAAHYRLALSCVRAVRAMERYAAERQAKKLPVHIEICARGPMWSVRGTDWTPRFTNEGALLTDAILTALPEPPHAE